ncbi:hypothetical protein GCM10009603_60110 [Nocardiopsis exhalans]
MVDGQGQSTEQGGGGVLSYEDDGDTGGGGHGFLSRTRRLRPSPDNRNGTTVLTRVRSARI